MFYNILQSVICIALPMACGLMLLDALKPYLGDNNRESLFRYAIVCELVSGLWAAFSGFGKALGTDTIVFLNTTSPGLSVPLRSDIPAYYYTCCGFTLER
jgi:hypothetical protein